MSLILVTGGAKGLGAEIAKQLTRANHRVLIQYNNSSQSVDRVVEACEGGAEKIFGDLSTPDGTSEFLTRLPQVSGLVNNVGPFEGEWNSLFQVNFFAARELSETLQPQTIVNIGVSGLEHGGMARATAYGCAKAALLFYTRSLAKRWASRGATVNMVSPGYMENSLVEPDVLPMGRLARLEEVAEAVVYLFSPAARYITGQNLEIAGGL